MSLGHVVDEGTTGQNSRGIDGIDIVVWDLAMQKLVDVVAMAKSCTEHKQSAGRDQSSQNLE